MLAVHCSTDENSPQWPAISASSFNKSSWTSLPAEPPTSANTGSTCRHTYSTNRVEWTFFCSNMFDTHTHNRFTALLEYVRDHPGEQVPERYVIYMAREKLSTQFYLQNQKQRGCTRCGQHKGGHSTHTWSTWQVQWARLGFRQLTHQLNCCCCSCCCYYVHLRVKWQLHHQPSEAAAGHQPAWALISCGKTEFCDTISVRWCYARLNPDCWIVGSITGSVFLPPNPNSSHLATNWWSLSDECLSKEVHTDSGHSS